MRESACGQAGSQVASRRVAAAFAALATVALAACARSDPARDRSPAVGDAAAGSSADTAATPTFADCVWRVVHSTAGTTGDYYVFLSDGSLLISAILANDTPVIMGVTFVFSCLVILFNLLADLLYGWLDPRISYR